MSNLDALQMLDQLPPARRREAEGWQVARLIIAGGPSLVVVKVLDFDPAVALVDALDAVQREEQWARRAELHLVDGRLLVLHEGRTPFTLPSKEPVQPVTTPDAG